MCVIESSGWGGGILLGMENLLGISNVRLMLRVLGKAFYGILR